MTSAALENRASGRGHHLPAAGVAALAVALLAGLPSLLGDGGRLAAVLVVQLALVVGWVLTTGIEGFLGSLAVGAAAAGAADLVLVLPAQPDLGRLLAVLGVGFLANVLQQMLRRPRTAVVASLAGALVLLCAVCALSVFLLEGRSALAPAVGTSGILAVGGAVVAAHLVDLGLPRPRVAADVPRGPLGLVLAIVVGAGVAWGRHGAAPGSRGVLAPTPAALLYGAVLGAVAALAGLVASYLAVEDRAVERGTVDHPTAARGDPGPNRTRALSLVQGILPFAACAPVAVALQAIL